MTFKLLVLFFKFSPCTNGTRHRWYWTRVSMCKYVCLFCSICPISTVSPPGQKKWDLLLCLLKWANEKEKKVSETYSNNPHNNSSNSYNNANNSFSNNEYLIRILSLPAKILQFLIFKKFRLPYELVRFWARKATASPPLVRSDLWQKVCTELLRKSPWWDELSRIIYGVFSLRLSAYPSWLLFYKLSLSVQVFVSCKWKT